jgi:choline-sulfatase
MEYAAEGSIAPMVALREGAWKYIRCAADPDSCSTWRTTPRNG